MKKNIHLKIILPLLLLLILGGVGGYLLMHKHSTVKTTPSGVKLTPATAQERADSEQKKQQIITDQQTAEQEDQQQSSKKSVDVVITNASSSTVNAYVSGVFEDGGVCTATFSKNGMSLTKQSAGFQNASNTQCVPIQIADGFLSPGEWSVSVSYSSDTAAGVSSPRTIKVE